MQEVQVPKKKSALDFLKGAFIQEELTPERPQQSAFVPSSTAVTPVVQHNAGIEKATKSLQESLVANCLDSYDYLKFKNTVQDLAGDIADERLRYKTAYSAAKAMGITPDKLVQTANHYIMVLDQELKNFNEAVDDQVETRVVSGLNKLKDLDTEITAKNTQIQALNAEITSLSTQRAALATKVNEDKNVIETNKNGFLTAQASLVEGIKNDIKKLSSYLG